MQGTRGRIGLMTLVTGAGVLPEANPLLPAEVTISPAPNALPRGKVTPAALSQFLPGDELARAAHLLTGIEPRVILASHGQPVVTSNQAGAWLALARHAIPDAIPGSGHLLTGTNRPAVIMRPLETMSP